MCALTKTRASKKYTEHNTRLQASTHKPEAMRGKDANEGT